MSLNQNRLSVQQINTLAVQALSYSAYATSIGIAMATMGDSLSGIKPEDQVLKDLRYMFGSSLVDEAIKNVGKDADVIVLARELDKLFNRNLVDKYGQYIADMALNATFPGDTKKVEEIAKVLAGQKISYSTPEPTQEVALQKAVVRASIKYPPRPQKDNITGKVYKSQWQAYKSVATEYGYDPAEHRGIYKLKKEHPNRFSNISMDEYLKVISTGL